MAQQQLLQKTEARPRGGTIRRRTSTLGYLLVAPVVICLLVLVVYPFAFAIWISFTDRVIGRPGQFVGLANFAYLFGQSSFQATVRNTIVLVVAVQLLKLVASMGIALLLNQPIRARQFWRSLILLPWAMPAFVAYMTWKLLYDPLGGAFNMILIGTGLVNVHVDFLGTKELAMPSVIIATFWRGFPFWVISFLAALQNVPLEQTNQYGIVRPQSLGVRMHRIADIVEKPQPESAPSTLGVVGRYIFNPEIFDYLERTNQGAGGEIQLTDAIAAMLDTHPALAYEFKGKRYDCGSKLGYLQASIVYALKHPTVAKEFGSFITQLQVDKHQRKLGGQSA